MFVYAVENRRSTWYIGVKRTKNGISEYGEHAADDVSVGCSRFLVRKKNIIGETGRKDMVNFCLYVTLPFNIFHSFQMEWEWSMLKSFAPGSVSCDRVLYSFYNNELYLLQKG